MAELETVARPYADAVFDMAKDAGDMDSWSNALEALAAIVTNDDAVALIHDPTHDHAETAELIIAIGGDDIGPQAANLVRLLAERWRLSIAPAIAEQFEAMRAQLTNTLDVDVIAAGELDESQQQAISKALAKRMGQTIRLTVTTDEQMLGGAVIKAGDWVLDGSVAAQLTRMHQAMAH